MWVLSYVSFVTNLNEKITKRTLLLQTKKKINLSSLTFPEIGKNLEKLTEIVKMLHKRYQVFGSSNFACTYMYRFIFMTTL